MCSNVDMSMYEPDPHVDPYHMRRLSDKWYRDPACDKEYHERKFDELGYEPHTVLQGALDLLYFSGQSRGMGEKEAQGWKQGRMSAPDDRTCVDVFEQMFPGRDCGLAERTLTVYDNLDDMWYPSPNWLLLAVGLWVLIYIDGQ